MSNYSIWGLFGPATWPWWFATLALLFAIGPSRWRRRSRPVLIAAIAAFVILAVLPTGIWLAEPLERRFPPPQAADLDIQQIIVLAGAERLPASARAGRSELSGAAERVTEGAALARSVPGARLWIVGGVRERRSPLADVEWTARLWRRMGVPPQRIVTLDGTLDTCANAAGVATRRPPGRLLLVTSALHMPRAVACFRKQGLRPVPYPVDYLNPKIDRIGDLFQSNLFANVERCDRALHEWLGLAYYRLQGRTAELFPAF